MILVTGATGNNGQELVRQLTALEQRVRALVRDASDSAKLKGLNVELAAGDFDRPETLDAALRGADQAFLLTPVAERFIQWQTDFIAAARRARVKHLVKFSGMGRTPRRVERDSSYFVPSRWASRVTPEHFLGVSTDPAGWPG